MAGSLSPRRRLRLIRQLQDSRDLLDAWDSSLRAVAVQTAHSSTSVPQLREPSEIAVLLAIVGEAKHGLEQRLAELGAESPHSSGLTKTRAVPPKSSRKMTSPLDLCLKACRACGRKLGAAFREAQSIADAASLRVLYDAIRNFEKQLWVLDPRQAY